MKNVRILFLLAIAVAIGFLAGSWTTPPTRVVAPTIGEVQEIARPVSIMFVYDGTKLDTGSLAWKEGLTLFDATKQVTDEKGLVFESKDYGDLGILVTAIGNKKNGNGDAYWQYWVNNEQVQVSANLYVVKPGDVISWQFRTSTM